MSTGSVAGSGLRLAVDVGGTFTDVVVRDRDGIYATSKVPTTPERVADGVLAGIDEAGATPADVDVLVHGTTIALNALLEGKTPPVALVTTEGFRDVLEIMRTNRPHMYDLARDKPKPLVPRRLRLEVSARASHTGEELRGVEEHDVERIAEAVRSHGVAAVAVCLLHAYADPSHEELLGRQLAAALPGVQVSLSSELTREWREFERTSTTVVNAATKPIMGRYLGDLTSRLGDRGFPGTLLIMQSNGGVTHATDASERPVASLMSGPAGAVAGASRLARELGTDGNLVTLDMGGTSADVAVIDAGQPTMRTVGQVGSWPILVPSLEIEAIGAGGGSLARVDAFGALSVGPESAGSMPGPACYGRGGTGATVTDAHVVLGRIDAAQVLGGTVSIDGDAARRAVADAVARPYGITVERAADGIVEVVNSNMARLLWEMLIGRGRDPRDFSLVAVGGAGGLHACELADGLGMRSVIVPFDPGAFSALGMLAADTRHDLSQTISTGRDGSDPDAIASEFGRLERLLANRLRNHGLADEQVELHRAAELRYRGQRSGVQVAIPPGLAPREAVDAVVDGFARDHERLFGFARPGHAVELVRLHVTAIAHPPAAPPRRVGATSRAAGVASRQVYASGQLVDARVLARTELAPGDRRAGPCIVEELTATTYVPRGWVLAVDTNGNLVLRRAAPATGGPVAR